jgi:HSP20 family molecular chaperone IbpA
MKTRIRKQGDSETRNDLVMLEDTDDENFGKHIYDDEGQLTVDVYETEAHLVIIAPVAGVEISDIEITVSDGEVLTIRGVRSVVTKVKEDEYLTRECFWGAFSRSIVLPELLDVDSISAGFLS